MEQEILTNEQYTRRDVFSYAIEWELGNGRGEQKGTGWLEIVFINGKFHACQFPFSGPYTREQWDILAATRERIVRIEQYMTQRGVKEELYHGNRH